MTIERRLGCEFVGLSTDAKPDYPGIIDYRFYEVDTGTIYYYGGAAWAAVQGSKAVSNYTNKIMTTTDNDFKDAVAVDYPLSFGYHRNGSFIPAVSGPYLGGALAGMAVSVGAAENAFSSLDTDEGAYQNFRGNASGQVLGIQSTSSTNSMITTRGQNPYLKVRCKVDVAAGVRLWVGFTSNQTLPASNTVLGSSDSGIIMGFGSATTNFSVFYNDGTTTAATQAFSLAKDNDWHTYEITMSLTTVICSLDGQQILLPTQIPNTATSLYLNCLVQFV
jgi:hypothetical protein